MVRSYWKGTLVVALAWPGLVWGQQPQGAAPMPAAPSNADNLVLVQECGKPAQKCRVLKCWCLPDGTPARDVQDVGTGEVMTILDGVPHNLRNAVQGVSPPASAPVSSTVSAQPMPDGSSSRVYHWSGNTGRPDGVPMPPGPGETAAMPAGPPQDQGLLHRLFSRDKSTTVVQAPMTTATVTTVALPPNTPLPEPTPTAPLATTTSPAPTPPPAPTATAGNPFSTWPTPPPPSPAPTPTTTVNKTPSTPPAPPMPSPTANNHATTPPVAQPMGRQPPADVCSEKAGPLSPDAAAVKPGQLGNCGCEKPNDAATVVSAGIGKPFLAKPGTWPPKTVVQGTTPPPPSDWRQSWGKPQPAAPAAAPPPAPPPTAAQPPKPATPTPPAVASAPPPQWPTQVEMPRANPTKPDPLQQPVSYSHNPQVTPPPVPGVQVASATAPPAKAPVVVAAAAATAPAAAAPAKAAAPATTAEVASAPVDPKAPGTASTEQRLPLGSGSVLAAYNDKAGGAIYLPVPVVTLPGSTAPRQVIPTAAPKQVGPTEAEVNAFSPTSPLNRPGSEPLASNAFSSGLTPAPMSGSSPMGSMNGTAMARAMPGQMYSGPMPPQPIAQASYRPNAPAAPYPGMPGYRPPVPPYPAVSASQVPTWAAQNPQQLMLTLKDALYPSHREWAASALAGVDWQTNPQVVEALMTAAHNDPAATVRSGCVRALGRMNVHSPLVLATLEGLKADPDQHVREDVEQALNGLNGQTVQELQPVSGVLPK